MAIETWQVPWLFVIYGAGFAAIFVCYALLYLHAWRERDALELDDLERAVTRAEITRNLVLAALGGLSALIALVLPAGLAGVAGYSYVLIGVIETWHGVRLGRIRKRHQRPAV